MVFTRRRLLHLSKMRTSHLVRNLLVLALGFVLGSCMYITMDKAEHMHRKHKLTIANFVPLIDALRAPPALSIHRKPASHGGASQSGIPRIIHQTWHIDDLPPQLQQWTRTWRLNHMNWDYYYWTQKGGQNLIETKFPKLVKTYNRYPSSVHKANVHKYAMMYTRGGLIVDADVENLRRVDRLLDTFPCILSLEPREHNVLLREGNRSDIIVVDSIMACKPKHKFFEIVLNLLPQYLAYAQYDDGTLSSVSESTGTTFLSQALDLYNQVYSDAPSGERVHVLPPSWLMPTYDGVFENFFWKKCTTQYLNLPWDQRKSCVDLVKKNFENVPSNYSFARPHWSRTESGDLKQLEHLMKLNGFEGDIPPIIPTTKPPFVKVTTKDVIPNQMYGDGIALIPVTDMYGHHLSPEQNKIQIEQNLPAPVKEKPWRNAFSLKGNQTQQNWASQPLKQSLLKELNPHDFKNEIKKEVSENQDQIMAPIIKDELDPLNAALVGVNVPVDNVAGLNGKEPELEVENKDHLQSDINIDNIFQPQRNNILNINDQLPDENYGNRNDKPLMEEPLLARDTQQMVPVYVKELQNEADLNMKDQYVELDREVEVPEKQDRRDTVLSGHLPDNEAEGGIDFNREYDAVDSNRGDQVMYHVKPHPVNNKGHNYVVMQVPRGSA